MKADWKNANGGVTGINESQRHSDQSSANVKKKKKRGKSVSDTPVKSVFWEMAKMMILVLSQRKSKKGKVEGEEEEEDKQKKTKGSIIKLNDPSVKSLTLGGPKSGGTVVAHEDKPSEYNKQPSMLNTSKQKDGKKKLF